MNKHVIKLVEDKQLSYRPINSLESIKLEILKTYTKTYLKTEFIQHFKFLVSIPIFFYQKSDKSLCLYIDHQDLNNLIIKNWNPPSLISEALNWQGQAKYWTELDLTSAYYLIRIWESDE